MVRSKAYIATAEKNISNELEKKHIEFLITLCLEISSKCGKKELKVAELKRLPHYTTVFRQIKTHLELILKIYQNLKSISDNGYLVMIKNEMNLSFSEFYKFITEEASAIGRLNSTNRKKFFNYIVHFKFLALELLAYFPNGEYNTKNVTITKSEPKKWWEKNFPNRNFVLRKDFMKELCKHFCFQNEAEAKSFENCIDFTKTNYVTTFEFDIMTRLYDPWKQLISVWKIIYNHSGYLHYGTYGEAEDILTQHLSKAGSYLFRVSCSDLGCWTIEYVKPSKKIGHVKVNDRSLFDALTEGRWKKLYLYPNGETLNPDISVYQTERHEIYIDDEQLEMYESFKDFKECKICRENDKDLMIEPCGHKMCETCFKSLYGYCRQYCPFCKQFMKSHTKIVHKIKSEENPGINLESSGDIPTPRSQLSSAKPSVSDTDECSNNRSDCDDEVKFTPEQTSPVIPNRGSVIPLSNTVGGSRQSQTLPRPQTSSVFKPPLPPGPSVPSEPPNCNDIKQDPFAKWTKPEVNKAMKTAGFNKEIALKILNEYNH